MWDRLGPVELTPPFYFIVTWLWAIPFGTGELALRSVSAIAGVVTVRCSTWQPRSWSRGGRG